MILKTVSILVVFSTIPDGFEAVVIDQIIVALTVQAKTQALVYCSHVVFNAK